MGEAPQPTSCRLGTVVCRIGFADCEQLVGLLDGQRTQHDDVEQCEQRAVGADAERKSHDGGRREGWSAAERPGRVGQILPEGLEHRYSMRSASTGLTRIARRAGTSVASTATPSRNALAAAN